MTVMAHPSAEDLLQFVRGQLPEADVERVIKHLESCSKCESFVAAAPADSFVNQLRDAKPLPSTEEDILNRAGSISTQPEYATSPSNECGDLPAELLQHERYRFINKLGGGGMGVVYLAEQKLMKRKVAVKLMPQSLANNPAAVERFLNEIVACAKLEHQNVVRAYSAERFGSQMLFEMEFVDGQDLADVVKLKGPLPVRYAMNYIKQAAIGLQQAHKEGLVHRDIKPRNIMLTKDGQIKVADFGLAKFQLESGEEADRRDLTGDDKMMGTPDYMAPEQSRNAKSADIRADIYSLGCTFYFLLTGKAPFRGRTMMDVVFAHTEQPVPDVRNERPTVPANVAEMIKTMMAKKPADRLQSPKEVVEVLVEIERSWSLGEQSQLAQQPDPFEGLDDDTEIVAKVAKPKQPTSKLVIAALALVGVSCLVCLTAIVLLASGVIRLTTPKGTIELVGIEPDMDVMIDGEKMVVTWDSGKQKAEIQVSAGRPHKVEVLRNGSTLRAWDSIELVENGRKLFEVKLVAAKAAAKPVVKLDFQAEYSDVSQLKWTINGEELIQPSDETYGALLFGDRAWNNFDFTVELKRVKGDHGVKLLFDYQDQNHHSVSDFGCWANKWHSSGSYVEGVFQKDSEVSIKGELEQGKWYRAELRVRGNTATTYLEGKQILEYKLPRQIAGRIGLSTNMTSFHFRNISVKTSDGKVLLEGLPESPRVKIDGASTTAKRFQADTIDFRRAEWKVEGSELLQNSILSRDLLLFDDPKQDEFDFSVDLQRISGTLSAGLLYSYQDLQNYSWYSVGANDNKTSYLAYSVNGKATYPDEASVAGSLEMKKWYRLELKVRRNMAMAYLDGKKILEYPQAGPHKGRIGIWTFNSIWRFRNIKLTDTQGKVLREGLPDLPQQSNSMFYAKYSDVSQLKWTINGEELIQPSDETGGLLHFGESHWRDFDYSVELKRLKGDYGIELIFDYTDQNEYSCVALGSSSNKSHTLGSYHEGIFQKDSSVSMNGGLESGKWYRAELRVRGNTATTYLDGKQIFEHKLSRPTAGRIGLCSNKTCFCCRNISVKTPDGKVLLEGLPESPQVKTEGSASKAKRFPAISLDFHRAEWKIDGNELVQNSLFSRDMLLFDDPRQDEFDFSVDVQRISGTMCVGLLYNYQDSQNYSWYSVGANDNKISYLAYSVNGKETYPDELKVPGSLEMKKWYKLELKVRRNMAMAYLDGKKILEYPQSGPHKGRIGIWTFNSIWRFRNIKLTDTQGKLLREGLPALPKPTEQTAQKSSPFLVESPHKSEGKWSIEGNELVQASDQVSEILVFGDPAWKNFNFSLEAKWKSGAYGFGLLFDYQDYMNYSAGALAVRENSKHELCTHEDGIYQENRAALVNGNLEPDRWYRVEVRVRENSASLHLDGKQLCEYKLAEPLSGRLALATYGSSCRFRNLTVQSADGKILLEGLPVAASVNAVNAVAGLKRFPAEFVDLNRADWKLNGDELVQGSRFSRDLLLFDDLKAEEFDFSAEVLRKSGIHAVGLVYNYQDLNNFYWYAISSHQNTLNMIGYKKGGEDVFPETASVVGTTVENQWYKMEIKVRKNLATAYLDGKKIVECPIDGGHKGRLGFWTFDSIYRFRNIKVADLQGKVLLEGLPVLPKPTERVIQPKTFKVESPPQALGKWSIEGNELVQASDESVELLVFGDPTWKNFDLSLEAKRTKGTDAISLIFDYQDFKNFSNMAFGGWGNTWHEMGSYKNQHFQQDQAVSVEGKLNNDQWYSVELRVRGTTATAYLEGKQILEYKLSKPVAGRIGLSTFQTGFRLRNITVKDDSGKVLLEGLPESAPILVKEPTGAGKRFPATIDDFKKADWKIEGNELVQDSRFSREVLIFDDLKADEFDFSADVLRTYGEQAVGLVYNYQNLKNYSWYAISSHANEWYVIGDNKNGVVSVPDELSVKGTTALNQWYKMEVKVRKNIATAYLDGKKIVESPIEGGHKGRLGLWTFDSIYRFRNIKVTDPQGKVLLEGLPALPNATVQPKRYSHTFQKFVGGAEGNWGIENQELVQKSLTSGEMLQFGEPGWTDYEIDLDFKRTEGNDALGLYFRLQDIGNSHAVIVAGYANTGIYPQFLKDGNFVDFRDLGVETGVRNNVWYRLQVKVRGELARVYLDRKKLFEFPIKEFKSGRIGLSTYASEYHIRNITVREAGGKILLEGLPNLPPPRFPVTKLEVRETNWQIEGDSIIQKNVRGRGSLLFGDKHWENYEIQTEVKVLERGEIHGFGVYFRYQDYNENFSYNPGCLGGDWLVVHSWEPDAKTPQNMKGRQPAPLVLRSPLKLDHWHQVRIVVGPETGEMYLDGVKLGTINTKLHPRGQIGLAAWAGVYAFRNLVVKDLNGKVLVQGLPDLKSATLDNRWLIK
jgi:tRNA A-37 threonylcarbamoyl transferase component Bud32